MPAFRWKPAAIVAGLAGLVALGLSCGKSVPTSEPQPEPDRPNLNYQRRQHIDTGGFLALYDSRRPSYAGLKTLEAIDDAHKKHVSDYLAAMEEAQRTGSMPNGRAHLTRAALLHSMGKPQEAYEVLKALEAEIRGTPLEETLLYTVIYYQGVTGLRIGETENCIHCRGESSCILPLAPAAIHTNPAGSRKAIEHFTEYLRVFPDDFEVRWLLNLAHMTLGEHPDKVDPAQLIRLDAFTKATEHGIGTFREISHKVGLDRFNESGGSIMDDFDNDGLYDVVVTDWSTGGPMAFYKNMGNGMFEDRTKAAGLLGQYGGLTCFQTDFNNDGWLDIFVPRGAWMPQQLPIRPSLLRNNGNGTFTDVTVEAKLDAPFNSNSVSWADYDNDGFVDVFFSGQHRTCPLYRNKGDGTFEEVGARAGLPESLKHVLGAAWFDYDNDGFVDLFANVGTPPLVTGGRASGTPRLYHNNRNGTFTDVTKEMGITWPDSGFSCWAFDYDNDGWTDLFAISTIHSLEDIVKGMVNEPHSLPTPVLYKNMQGKGFKDVSKEMGVDKVCAPMGTNFADFDNDGFLDYYLATGNPDLATLVPNRMFRNLGGTRFAEITASSRTGHLQKGHSVAIGDWNRNGSLDIFVQLGGAVPGDRYHNVLFENPGQGNNWLSIKLVGKKTNRAAFGARIKVTTSSGQVIHRHVGSGSSFGANPLEQHIGLGKADRATRVEITWPTSGTTQVFEHIPAGRGLVITEFADKYDTRTWKPIPVPE